MGEMKNDRRIYKYKEHPVRSRILLGLLFAACILLPLIWHRFFNTDYANHLWISRYYAQYFKQRHTFPLALHTQSRVGIAYPLYYGYLYYQVIGFFALLVGGVRNAYVLSSGLLFLEIFYINDKLFAKLLEQGYGAKGRLFAHAVAFMAICNPYMITNLYSRGAMTEYYAVLFLYAALAAWFYALQVSGLCRKIFWISLSALHFAITIGSHPITAQVGGDFLRQLCL